MRRIGGFIRVSIVALIAGATSNIAVAQEPPGTELQAGHGAFQVGYMQLGLTDLNAALTASGYPAIDDQFLTIGGTGFGGPGRWLFGGDGQALLGSTKTTTSGAYQVSLNGGYGMFRVGYNVSGRDDIDLYPSLGIGAGAMNLNIRGRSTPTFADVLATPARSSNMTQAGFLMGLGLTGNYRIRIQTRESDRIGGLLLGLTGGYLLSPAHADWQLDGINDVAGGPAVRMQGWYARISFGGWSRGPKRR